MRNVSKYIWSICAIIIIIIIIEYFQLVSMITALLGFLLGLVLAASIQIVFK